MERGKNEKFFKNHCAGRYGMSYNLMKVTLSCF